MKIIALAILFILLFCRIKGTPNMLSKKLYMKRMQKVIDKNQESLKALDDDRKALVQSLAVIFTWGLEIFFSIFYIVLGTKLGTTYMLILSALQVFTCVYTSVKQVNTSAFSQNIEDFKFYRWYFLFNVILDYMYYPVAIYMLLMK
jgi:uncharacterized membrane protein